MRKRPERISSTVKLTASMSAVVQKDLRVAKQGFLQAAKRLETAVDRGADGSDDVYISIAEAGAGSTASQGRRTSLTMAMFRPLCSRGIALTTTWLQSRITTTNEIRTCGGP